MTKRPNKAEAILDSAEHMARTGGYMGFSFREIAKDVGIKAASVHYHFPGKDDLGAALAERYTDRFMTALGDPDSDVDPTQLLETYIKAYRTSLVDDGLMCLCGMLGAEVASLPPAVASETKSFFLRNLAWLEAVLARRDQASSPDQNKADALRMIAMLEGAMIVARTLEDTTAFDTVVSEMTD